jgi:hypothetical protein
MNARHVDENGKLRTAPTQTVLLVIYKQYKSSKIGHRFNRTGNGLCSYKLM